MTQAKIETTAALIASLKENPARRAVCAIEYGDGVEYDLCVMEFDNHQTASPRRGRRIARLVEKGEAARMLERAEDADTSGDRSTWAALAVRYGPYCSTWVLPEHPAAPSGLGADG